LGCAKNIAINDFPKQGGNLGRYVDVCFRYDSSKRIRGVIVRDDKETPYITLIKLDDDRYVLDIECQYSLLD